MAAVLGVLGVLLMLGSGGFCALLFRGHAKVRTRLRILSTGVLAEGKVTAIWTDFIANAERPQDAEAIPRLIVTFTDSSGEQVSYKESFTPAKGVAVGTYIPVRYDPEDPKGTAGDARTTKQDLDRLRLSIIRSSMATGAVFLLGLLLVAGVIR
jgi:hypothetical protein